MATNAVLTKMGTPVVFTASGGDVTFTLDDTVDLGNGQVSNQWDRGTSAVATTYKLSAAIKWVATPTLGDVVRIYLYDSQNTSRDLTGDGDVTPETKFGNFRFVGQVICSVAADQTFYGSFVVEILGRYVNLGVWNASATKDLNATANACNITLTPCYPDIQAAA
jgi:hypothetical protein